mmetsp:Transcript_28563/g.70688  ORF Transcript_28563/g.70688 Transcript_28563/m.70688 type:complete len:218 (+) Transcript_28563:649-1302(+)
MSERKNLRPCSTTLYTCTTFGSFITTISFRVLFMTHAARMCPADESPTHSASPRDAFFASLGSLRTPSLNQAGAPMLGRENGFDTGRGSGTQSCRSCLMPMIRTHLRASVSATTAHCMRFWPCCPNTSERSRVKDVNSSPSISVWLDLRVKVPTWTLISVSTAAVVVMRSHSSKPFSLPTARAPSTVSLNALISVSGHSRPTQPGWGIEVQRRAHPF